MCVHLHCTVVWCVAAQADLQCVLGVTCGHRYASLMDTVTGILEGAVYQPDETGNYPAGGQSGASQGRRPPTSGGKGGVSRGGKAGAAAASSSSSSTQQTQDLSTFYQRTP